MSADAPLRASAAARRTLAGPAWLPTAARRALAALARALAAPARPPAATPRSRPDATPRTLAAFGRAFAAPAHATRPPAGTHPERLPDATPRTLAAFGRAFAAPAHATRPPAGTRPGRHPDAMPRTLAAVGRAFAAPADATRPPAGTRPGRLPDAMPRTLAAFGRALATPADATRPPAATRPGRLPRLAPRALAARLAPIARRLALALSLPHPAPVRRGGATRRPSAAALRAACAALCLAPAAAAAQGFAGLGSGGQDYAAVSPGRAFDFPADHGPHPGFRIEWWYVTANLEGPDGEPYGVQWTLFRQAISPDPSADGWGAPQVWMGHAALTSASRHLAAEKFGRGGVGQAGVRLDPFQAWIDAWRLESLGDGFSPLRLSASGDGFAFDLALEAHGPVVLQGDRGYSRKSERAQASYYYSQPFFEAVGEIVLDGEPIRVTGRAWLDREWSSQPLDEDQEGWDWFSLHLPEGEKLMLYRLRHADGADWHASTWIGADGAVEPLSGEAVRMRPLAVAGIDGREVPVEWELEVPSRNLKIRTEPLNPQSWMPMSFPYWEGPIRFEGTHDGVGYLEMTGY